MTATVEEKEESSPPEENPTLSGLTRANHVQKVLAVGIAAIAVLAVSLIVQRVASSSGKNYSGAVTTQGVANLNFTNRGRVNQVNVQPGQRVHKGDVLATQAFGATQALIDADNAAIASAQDQLAALQAQVPVNAVAVSNAKGVLAHDRAQLAQHRTELSAAQVRAPSDGVVLAVNGQPGDVVDNDGVRQYGSVNSSGNSVQDPAFSLLPKGPSRTVNSSKAVFLPFVSLRTSNDWTVIAQVPERSTRDVPVGADVDVSVPAANIDHAKGKLMQILPTPVGNGNSVSYQILVRIDGGSGKPPLPGMTADLTIKN
ncbi:MAG TPA: biotin/lipoyl-binding protein [Mycobacteriales bacterium]|nr:biotin/lipoyl-binding protein [Mycobacteriales bacterium]